MGDTRSLDYSSNGIRQGQPFISRGKGIALHCSVHWWSLMKTRLQGASALTLCSRLLGSGYRDNVPRGKSHAGTDYPSVALKKLALEVGGPGGGYRDNGIKEMATIIVYGGNNGVK